MRSEFSDPLKKDRIYLTSCRVFLLRSPCNVVLSSGNGKIQFQILGLEALFSVSRFLFINVRHAEVY